MKLFGRDILTGEQRTLWRTHSVVCRRCKAKPNLSGKRTETMCKVRGMCMSSPQWDCFFVCKMEGDFYHA